MATSNPAVNPVLRARRRVLVVDNVDLVLKCQEERQIDDHLVAVRQAKELGVLQRKQAAAARAIQSGPRT